MDDVTVIDRFLDTFSRYIDSGFGVVGGDVAFLTSTLLAIDMTLAGLMWAMGASDDEVILRFLRKVLYVGAFAYIIQNFNGLSKIVFDSFAGLGLKASQSSLASGELLRPGRIAQLGYEVSTPILEELQNLAGGFYAFFSNIGPIVVLLLTWLVVIIAFFVLAIQIFVAIIEFKLVTLAGFVLVPFALWRSSAFLAERVLGAVIGSGVKILVLAVVIGIGSGLIGELPKMEPGAITTRQALSFLLASMALLALGIYGPSVAGGLVSGSPQLAAGSAVSAGGAIRGPGSIVRTVRASGGGGGGGASPSLRD